MPHQAAAGPGGESAPARTPIILRWDLDKTYLATDFESFRAMMRIPFEGAEDKRSLPGVRTLIRTLQEEARSSGQPLETYFITASPPQIRRPIEEKLRQDGIEVDDIVYKDQVRALLRGRFRSLKEHVAYKLRALLQHHRKHSLEHARAAAHELLFGDDWEMDPLVYTLYADLISGAVDDPMAEAVLRLARVEPRKVEHLLEDARVIRRFRQNAGLGGGVVERIFIHRARARDTLAGLQKFGGRLLGTANYLQTAALLHALGHLRIPGVIAVARELEREHGWHPAQLRRAIAALAERSEVRQLASWEQIAEIVASAFDPSAPTGLQGSEPEPEARRLPRPGAAPEPRQLDSCPVALAPRAHLTRNSPLRRRAAALLDRWALAWAERRLGWLATKDNENEGSLPPPDYRAILVELINGAPEGDGETAAEESPRTAGPKPAEIAASPESPSTSEPPTGAQATPAEEVPLSSPDWPSEPPRKGATPPPSQTTPDPADNPPPPQEK